MLILYFNFKAKYKNIEFYLKTTDVNALLMEKCLQKLIQMNLKTKVAIFLLTQNEYNICVIVNLKTTYVNTLFYTRY